MSEPEMVVVAVPEPNSPAMVNCLGNLIDDVIEQIPFSFSCSDLMNALMYAVADAGLQGAESPEKLCADIKRAVDEIVADVVRQRKQMKDGLN